MTIFKLTTTDENLAYAIRDLLVAYDNADYTTETTVCSNKPSLLTEGVKGQTGPSCSVGYSKDTTGLICPGNMGILADFNY